MENYLETALKDYQCLSNELDLKLKATGKKAFDYCDLIKLCKTFKGFNIDDISKLFDFNYKSITATIKLNENKIELCDCVDIFDKDGLIDTCVLISEAKEFIEQKDKKNEEQVERIMNLIDWQ